MKFIDEVTICVASGKGGPGCVSFRREAKTPRGGPDGGDGGKGGDVVFRTNSRLTSLLDLRYKKRYQAQNGEPGKGQNQTGADGEDLVIQVPGGTVVRDMSGVLLADLGNQNEFVFLKGGRGGKGNTFYKSSVNQAPMKAQKGEIGQEAEVHLELKLLADVGIIGLPNAGKSTLISRISAAKPKVADYPFTTLIPHLGVVQYSEGRTYVVADIPGLVRGAHEGVGLGIQFLKHIERTKVFVHMIDTSGVRGSAPIDDYEEIRAELRGYDNLKKDREDFEPLSKRPEIVVLNKIDSISEERLDEIKQSFQAKNIEVLAISAVVGKNVDKLKYLIGQMVFGDEKHD